MAVRGPGEPPGTGGNRAATGPPGRGRSASGAFGERVSLHYNASRFLLGGFVSALSGWEVRGREHVPSQGGLIIADNTLLFGMVAKDEPGDIAPTTWENMRRFNERLADSEKYFSIMIPTQEGLTVAVKLF